jgi:chromosome segregation ATPase
MANILRGGRKQPDVSVELSPPVAPAAPPSRLARAQATVQTAEEARQLVRAEITTLRERQHKAERELNELDHNAAAAEGNPDVGARLDRRLAMQQEMAAIRDMLPTAEQRHRQADQKLSQARDEETAVKLRIAGFRQRIDEQQGRIRRQQRAIEEAESQVMGHRNGLANLERSVATTRAELEQMAGAELA